LSGAMQVAGGVGGLLMVRQVSGAPGTHFATYDGNGNLVVLLDGSNGIVTARYEYDPFGQTIRATGDMARNNPFRFSTKWTGDESGLSYYGYRYYASQIGRWTSRDPLATKGMPHGFVSPTSRIHPINLKQEGLQPAYLFSVNSPVNFVDLYGLLNLQEVSNMATLGRPAGVNDSITPFVMLCLLWKESSFNATARNANSSARGIAQILNGTADDIQDRIAPRFGGQNAVTALGSGQRLRNNRDNPELSVTAAYLYLDDRFTSTGSLSGALAAYGPGGAAVLQCASCLSRNCGLQYNQNTGTIQIVNAAAAQRCLNIVHR
jgi:RHS repeat-associated protein